MSKRPLLWFLAVSALLSLFVFRDAPWGQSLLAPVDIAPALFSKYRWMDPQSTGIPANHHAIDQLTYDLPLQHTIYHAVRRGEMPWWDPYAWCGHPLLADAHINGTDPIRLLLYLLLPFALAYNWTLILHFFFGGLGMFLLLRHLQFKPWNCVLWALTYQFASGHTVTVSHPWIQASFIYYPYLWLMWDRAFTDPKPLRIACASLLVAAVFYTGNLQSHSYLVIFALAMLIGYGWKSPSMWKRILPVIALTGLAGAMLAAPVLGNQVELFVIAQRKPIINPLWVHLLNIPAILASPYPWLLGTHRTLDLSKLSGEQTLAFRTFIGSAAVVLALFAAFFRHPPEQRSSARRASIMLLLAYVFVLATPLVDYVYSRCAGLAVMGLVLLAAFAVETLIAAPQRKLRFARAVGALTVVTIVAVHFGTWVVYPKLIPKILQSMEQRGWRTASLDEARALRQFQVHNLPREVSFQNPETVLAFLALLAVAGIFAAPKLQQRPGVWVALLVLNAIPSLMFCHRFVPRHPITLWEQLLAGGPEQQRVAALMANKPLRLREQAAQNDMLMGGTLNHLYKVRTVHGYAALAPLTLGPLPPAQLTAVEKHLADFTYTSPIRGLDQGILRTNHPGMLARFQWQSTSDRRLSVAEETLSTIRLRVDPGPAAHLIWADTHCPGWKARAGSQPLSIKRTAVCLNLIEVPESAREVVLEYRPTYLVFAWVLALGGVVLIVLAIVWLRAPTQQTIAEPLQVQ